MSYIRQLISLKPERIIGHNPVEGVMVFVFLSMLVIITVSGIVYYGIKDNAGRWMDGFLKASWLSEGVLEEDYEVAANVTVVVAIIHQFGVISESFLHRENLIASMWHGRKRAN